MSAMSGGGDPSWITTSLLMLLGRHDCEGVLVLHSLYEVELATALSRMLYRGCVFIDVGAHVGR